MKAEPSLFKVEPMAHGNLTLKGEFVRTLTMTGGTGIQLRAMRNNAHVHSRSALDVSLNGIPYRVLGLTVTIARS